LVESCHPRIDRVALRQSHLIEQGMVTGNQGVANLLGLGEIIARFTKALEQVGHPG
jgi:hypothetical protein